MRRAATTPGTVVATTMMATVGVWAMAGDWWDPAWKYRLPVRVNFGMEETENPLVSARIGRNQLKAMVADVDPRSFRVVDGHGSELPCAVRTDAGGDLFVVWRIPGPTEILDSKNYHIYLGSSAAGFGKRATVEPLTDIPAIVPGMNLVSNGDFSALDANGFPTGWVNIDLNSNKTTEWGEADREGVTTIEQGGRTCLRLAGGRFVVYAVSGLTAGASYKASLFGTTDPGATILVTIVYRRENFDWFRNGIKNYKTQFTHATPGRWSSAEAATFVYTDKNGNPHVNDSSLLPETETAYMVVQNHQAPEGAFVYVTDVRLELAGDTAEAQVVVGVVSEK